MDLLPPDETLWKEVERRASEAVWSRLASLDQLLIRIDVVVAMQSSEEEWLDPPSHEHYREGDRESFIAERVRRAAHAFTDHGPQVLYETTDRTDADFKAHVVVWGRIDREWRVFCGREMCHPLGEQGDNYPFWEALAFEADAMQRRASLVKHWADRNTPHRFSGLRRLVHEGNELAVHLGVADALTGCYRRMGRLPEAPGDLVDVHEDRGWDQKKQNQKRSDYNIVCAVADLHKRGKFHNCNSISDLSKRVEKHKNNQKGYGVSEGFTESTLKRRLPGALGRVLGVAKINQYMLNDLIPLIERFEQKKRPKRGLARVSEGGGK